MIGLSVGIERRQPFGFANFSSLFAAGEQGVIFDPSDISTLSQDSAGATPVTAAGDPVGRMLDLSGNGHHATQATASKRPIYGIHPFGGRRNLLTYSEAFDNAAWPKADVTVTANAAVAPDGASTADRLVESATTANHLLNRGGVVAGDSVTSYTLSYYAKADTREWTRLQVQDPATGWVNVNLTTGAVGLAGGGLASVTVADVGDGWWRISGTAVGVNAMGAQIFVIDGDRGGASPSYLGDGTSGILIWGAQFEQSATATVYQKVTSQYAVTETGVPSVHYLAFDGVDDAMATPSIDFSASDEMSVFAGARKLSDAASAVLAELSASAGVNSGSFNLQAPGATNVGEYRFNVRGTLQIAPVAIGYPLAAAVVSGLTDISSDNARIRVNGALASNIDSDAGTGNFGNYPLYIGARNQASAYFNGHLYGLTVRGALTAQPTLSRAESLMAQKTGIEL